MGRRTSATVAVLVFLVLASAVSAITAARGADANLPTPPSTYLAAPSGASAFAEALQRGGVPVERWRRTFYSLATADSAAPAPLLVVLGPGQPLTPADGELLITRSLGRGPILLAGPTARAAMRCWGYEPQYRGSDSIRVRWSDSALSANPAWVHWVLVPATKDTAEVPGPDVYAGKMTKACGRSSAEIDTLIVTAGRRPVLLRAQGKAGFPVYLLSDPGILANRSLRDNDLAPSLLRFIATAGAGVLIDEFHHGYTSGGGMVAAIVEWSGRSPWGWMAWQGIGVGAIALLVAMWRTGPIRSVLRRQRRSPLEHVRALATALRAARGHDVAVDLLVRGLRRRLSRDGRATREPTGSWLRQLQDRVRTPRARAAVARLGALTRPGRSAEEVLAAANAVEDVWQELRP
jgi:hypothetical protein